MKVGPSQKGYDPAVTSNAHMHAQDKPIRGTLFRLATKQIFDTKPDSTERSLCCLDSDQHDASGILVALTLKGLSSVASGFSVLSISLTEHYP